MKAKESYNQWKDVNSDRDLRVMIITVAICCGFIILYKMVILTPIKNFISSINTTNKPYISQKRTYNQPTQINKNNVEPTQPNYLENTNNVYQNETVNNTDNSEVSKEEKLIRKQEKQELKVQKQQAKEDKKAEKQKLKEERKQQKLQQKENNNIEQKQSNGTIYNVFVGSYSNEEQANIAKQIIQENTDNKLRPGIKLLSTGIYTIHIGKFNNKQSAENMLMFLNQNGFPGRIEQE